MSSGSQPVSGCLLPRWPRHELSPGSSPAHVQCLRCAHGWHVRCRPLGSALVSKKFLLCPRHVGALGKEEERQALLQQKQAAQPAVPAPEQQAVQAAVPALQQQQQAARAAVPAPEQRDAMGGEGPAASQEPPLQQQHQAQHGAGHMPQCRPPASPAVAPSQQLGQPQEQAHKQVAEAAEDSEEEGKLPSLAVHGVPPAPAGTSQQQPRLAPDPVSIQQQHGAGQAAGSSAAEERPAGCSAALAAGRAELPTVTSPRTSGSAPAASLRRHGAAVELLRAGSSRSSQTAASSAAQPELLRLDSVPSRQQAAVAVHPLSPRQALQRARAQPPSQQQQQQQQVTSPFATACPSMQQAVPDLDAPQLQKGPLASQLSLASGVSLQPSWQASLASRPALDYGEL